MKIRLLALGMGLAVAACAEIRIESPQEGATVPQLWPEQIAFLEMPREMRKINRDKGNPAAVKALKRREAKPRPVEIAWSGATGPCTVKVVRLPDGKVFHACTTTGTSVSITGRLEIARSWKATVSDGTATATVTFATEDRAPRIISLDGVRNARDLGGRIGLDGRRVKQGLLFRTGGLNHNAKVPFYTYEEIVKLHEEGRLTRSGPLKERWRAREYEGRLKRGKPLDRKALLLPKCGPTEPGAERLTDADRAYLLGFLGIRSDIDFRDDWECYGMTGSPLGDEVYWYHYNSLGSYGKLVTPKGRATTALAFSVLLSPDAYPIVFHCIGGTDRTGTFAYLLNALLGVDEEELVRDYEMSFIGGAGVTQQRYRWLETLITTVRELPGETLADKVKGYFISLGFTEEQIEKLREFLLEPKG